MKMEMEMKMETEMKMVGDAYLGAQTFQLNRLVKIGKCKA